METVLAIPKKSGGGAFKTCHRHRSTKLSTTFGNVWRTHAFRPMVAILSILFELGSRA